MDTSIAKLVNVVAMTISFLLLGNVCCQQTPAVDEDKYEGVQVNSNGTNNTPTPNNLRVTFRFGSFNVSLSLQRNPNVPSDVIVIVGTNGVLTRTKTNSSERFAHYIDTSSDASVLVRVETDGDGHVSHSFTGVFKIGNETYAFEPSTRQRKRRRRRRGSVVQRMERDTSVVTDQYVVHKEITQLDATSPSLTLPRELLKPPTAERQDPDSPGSGNSIDKPPEKPNYVVELMVFVDYNIYKKMYDLSTEPDKETDTLLRIKEYFGHIINGVDLRYRGINDSSFSINVRLVGFYIAKDANSSAFIENNRQGSGSSAYIAAQKAAYDFADWVNANKDSLPLFDQASLFTSEFLNGANGDRISGLAFYRSICSYYSVLLIRDSGEYGSSQTAAHELGHNLGAGHDGIDNMCSAFDQHIMVASSAPLTDAVYKNAYTFSTCSIDEMKSFLVTMSPNNCLQKLSSNSTIDMGTYEIPMGKLYRPDEQCAILYGNGSFYCSGQNEDKQICRSMGCYHPVWKYCLAPFEQRAFSGTQCGDHKWCFMGDCVSDPRADALYGSEDCMYGDSKAPFYDGFKCSNVTSQPWNCYKSTVANSCCHSCNAIRNDNLLGCEYGDLYPGCKNYEPLNCDDPSINSGCCQTCMDTQRMDCQSGDKITGCSATDCLDERKYYNCCRTCASYPLPLPTSTTFTTLTPGMTTQTTTSTTTPTTTTTSMPAPTTRSTSTTTTTSTTTPKTTSTPATSTTTQTTSTTTTTTTTTPTTTTTIYRPTLQLSQSCVDYDSVWCRDTRNFPPSNCYTSNMVYCCAYCYSIRDYSRPGCEYGDRYSWCSTSRCSNDDERKTCCGKCKDFLSTSTTTSTTTRTTTTPTTTTSPTTARTTTTPTTTTTTPTTTTTTPTTTTTTLTTTATTPTTTTTTLTTTATTPTTTTTTKTSTPTTTTTTPTKTFSTTTTTTTTPKTTTTTATTTTKTTPLTTKLSTITSTTVFTFKTTPTVGILTANLITTTPALKPGQATIDPACEDKSSICLNLQQFYCYSSFLRTICCKSCSNYSLGPPGCEYGDRESLCVRVNPDDCYMYREDCCRTCQGL